MRQSPIHEKRSSILSLYTNVCVCAFMDFLRGGASFGAQGLKLGIRPLLSKVDENGAIG